MTATLVLSARPQLWMTGWQAQQCKEPPAPRGAGRLFDRVFVGSALCLTENAVDLGSADWADALCHATTRVGDFYGSLELTLLFALNAVRLTLVCLCH